MKFVQFYHALRLTSLTSLQASDQFMEFLRNFYDVFPEYRTMDVRLLHSLISPVSFLIDTD
jgi:hypothetical protein